MRNEAMWQTLAERLVRERGKRGEVGGLALRLDALTCEAAALRDLDSHSPEENIGDDAQGALR